MAIGPANRIGDFEAILAGSSVAGLSDGELLARFFAARDRRAEIAFEALVLRHGQMVWGVCRRTLSDPTDADDAFQATFLILVRRARSVRVEDSLGRWLYGVSRRVAAKTRSERDRRRRRESSESLSDQPAKDEKDCDQEEILFALDDEVARLAEPFRSAIVLCDLGGLTHEQAALEVGCPVGTIKSRLARGRDRLRDRFIRRGFLEGGTTPGLGGVLSFCPIVPPQLVRSVILAAEVLVDSRSGVVYGSVFRSVVVFKNGGGSMMLLALKWFASGALVLGMGASGWLWVGGQTVPPPAAVKLTAASPAVPQIPREGAMMVSEYLVEPPDILKVEIAGTGDVRAITGERLVRPDGRISLDFYGEVSVAGMTCQEIKIKVLEHLKGKLTDKQLGLVVQREVNGVSVEEPVEPAKSLKVFVDVITYNSKVYYVQGDVGYPGRLPVTGHETVLDAIAFAKGVINKSKPHTMRLVRPAPLGGGSDQVLPIDWEAIVEKGDPTTNYQIKPGDRIVVTRVLKAGENADETRSANPPDLEPRLQEVERKLDLILKKLNDQSRP